MGPEQRRDAEKKEALAPGPGEAADSVFQGGAVEVDEKAKRMTRRAEVRDALRAMNGRDRVDRFHLDDHAAFDEEIHPPLADLHVLVHKHDRLLPLKADAAKLKLARQRPP